MQLRTLVFRALRANLHWLVAILVIGVAIIVHTHASTPQSGIVLIHGLLAWLP